MKQETLEESQRKAEVREFISKTGKDLGLIKKKRQYELTRSALIAYKELHGVEYVLPESAIIIED